MSKKPSLVQILADPKNSKVSSNFFKTSFVLFLLPIGFLIAVLQFEFLSVTSAGITAVLLVNLIMGIYAYSAYREDVSDWNDHLSSGKKN